MALGSTTSCRAFALMVCVLTAVGPARAADDKGASERPLLPIGQKWSVNLNGKVTEPPLSDGTRVFIVYASHELAALSVADHSELWRQPKDITCALALDGDLLFDCSADAIEARRTNDGSVAWLLPNIKTVAPLVAEKGWLLAVTDGEIIAIRDSDGTILWRRPAGGVQLAPAIDGDALYLGANDGRLVAFTLTTGDQLWQEFVPEGITALAGSHGRAYAGGGDKQFYCFNGSTGEGVSGWPWRIGALVEGHIAIDDDHVYFAALDNIVRALSRGNGNQRWDRLLRDRPTEGVWTIGHLVFVPSPSPNLLMLYGKDGHPSGNLTLPDKMPMDLPPGLRLTGAGLAVFAVTSGLSNTWVLTMFGPEPEPALEPLTVIPGLPYLTDPDLQTAAKGLWWLVAGDPPLRPLEDVAWPILLVDPPLQPLSALPGLQLRSLSPTLPIRRAPSGPGG
jgi:outer membrane protein assembly factor BamB